jgi:hypothetical protein
MTSLRSTALSDRLRLFRGIVGVLKRSIGRVSGVRVVLAVVFLSGAFGHASFPLVVDSNVSRPQSIALDSYAR